MKKIILSFVLFLTALNTLSADDLTNILLLAVDTGNISKENSKILNDFYNQLFQNIKNAKKLTIINDTGLQKKLIKIYNESTTPGSMIKILPEKNIIERILVFETKAMQDYAFNIKITCVETIMGAYTSKFYGPETFGKYLLPLLRQSKKRSPLCF